MKITQGMEVTAAYRFQDEHGILIDSSEQSGAMVFVHGEGSVLPGIEAALEGCVSGQKLSITLPPEQAFGPHRPELVFEAPLANLPPDTVIAPGVELFAGSGDRPKFRLRIVKATEDGALLDGNHPLAGKTLSIDLEVVQVALPA